MEEARQVFARWIENPIPARITDGVRPLVPWLLHMQAEKAKNDSATRDFLTRIPPDKPSSAVAVQASRVRQRVARFAYRTPQLMIPAGEITLAAGREGTGKSQWSAWLAARVTRGDAPGDWQGRPRGAVIIAREDSWQCTIAPRLAVARADLDRVYWVKVESASGPSELFLPTDLEPLASVIKRYDVGLVVLDPLSSTIKAGTDTHKAAEVRQALEPVAELAHQTGAAFVGLAHFGKAEGRDAASLISGSHAFKDLARAIIAFARDTGDAGVMTQVKNSLGKMPEQSVDYSIRPVDYRIDGEYTQLSAFFPGQPTSRHAEDLLDMGANRKVAEARDFLRGTLGFGPRPSKDVQDEADELGISKNTLARARKDLGIRAGRQGDVRIMSLQ